MADEVTSHGQEILSVCLRFLEIYNATFQHKPRKHEVLLDFSFLQRITGESIVQNILEVLKKQLILTLVTFVNNLKVYIQEECAVHLFCMINFLYTD